MLYYNYHKKMDGKNKKNLKTQMRRPLGRLFFGWIETDRTLAAKNSLQQE
jgi:hypothetical protein